MPPGAGVGTICGNEPQHVRKEISDRKLAFYRYRTALRAYIIGVVKHAREEPENARKAQVRGHVRDIPRRIEGVISFEVVEDAV